LLITEQIDIVERVSGCSDLKNNKFLELAVNCKTDVILSRDQDLRALRPFREFAIVQPAAFFELMGG
jgi:predicted nucleic acid-binding protein